MHTTAAQTENSLLSEAWALLVAGAYAQDLSVQDNTGVPHLPGTYSEFAADRATPSPVLCGTYAAWARYLSLAAGPAGAPLRALEPFRYDLVNLGREVLAQLSVPLSQNFSDALGVVPLAAATLARTGSAYLALLHDLDALLGTDPAFMLGPWLAMARALAMAAPGARDCGSNAWGVAACPDFYEWNARVQLTTWNPTAANASAIPGGPNDCKGGGGVGGGGGGVFNPGFV